MGRRVWAARLWRRGRGLKKEVIKGGILKVHSFKFLWSGIRQCYTLSFSKSATTKTVMNKHTLILGARIEEANDGINFPLIELIFT